MGATHRVALLMVLLMAGCRAGEVHRCTTDAPSVAPLDPSGEVIEDRTAGGRLQGPALSGPSRPDRIVFLLDYSGSMYGGYDTSRKNCPPAKRDNSIPYYYQKKNAEFRSLLTQLMDAATPDAGPTKADVLLFNQKLWRVAPTGLREFSLTEGLAGDVATAQGGEAFWATLDAIPEDPYKATALAADSTETSKAMTQVLDALPDEGMVWLLTDNIADQAAGRTSGEDARRNEAFYVLLRDDPRIQVAAFYPLHLDQPNGWMCGSSLVAYGFYVSKHERITSQEVARLWGTDAAGAGPLPTGLLWNPALKTLYESFGGNTPKYPEISGTPMRLKPVDQDVVAVAFVPLAEKDGRERVLRCRRASFDDPLRCEAQIVLRNMLRHQRVDSAQLDVTHLTLAPFRGDKPTEAIPWASSVCAGEMKVSQWLIPETGETGTTSPIQLSAIAPLQSRTVQIAFDVPPVSVGHDGLGQLLDIALTDAFELHGTLRADIGNVVTALHLDTSGFKDVYGIENLPQKFRGASTPRLRIEGPGRARFTNDGQRLAMLMLAGLVALVVVVLIFGLVMQRSYYTVRLDGQEHARIKLRRLGSFTIEVRGKVIARARRGFAGPARLVAGPGWRLKADGGGFIAAQADGKNPDDHRVELLTGWTNRNVGAARGKLGW